MRSYLAEIVRQISLTCVVVGHLFPKYMARQSRKGKIERASENGGQRYWLLFVDNGFDQRRFMQVECRAQGGTDLRRVLNTLPVGAQG